MRSISGWFLLIGGALLVTLGLGNMLYLPMSRDSQTRSIVIGAVLLLSGTIAIVAGSRVRKPPRNGTAQKEVPRSAASQSRLPRYLAYAAIPAVICTGFRALIQVEVIKFDEGLGTIATFLFGPPYWLVGLKLTEIGLGPIGGTAVVSLLYFWVFCIPAGKITGLLPNSAPQSRLIWMQSALTAIHFMWGFAFVFVMKA